MLDVPAPSAPFCHDPIILDELIQTLKKICCGSFPNPLDGIPYAMLKCCPSLHPALMHLYNTCLMTSHFPAMWRKAVIQCTDMLLGSKEFQSHHFDILYRQWISKRRGNYNTDHAQLHVALHHALCNCTVQTHYKLLLCIECVVLFMCV